MPTPEQLANRKIWVDNLMTGVYPQTQSCLIRLDDDGKPVGYCCLGVAQELFSPTAWVKEDTTNRAIFESRFNLSLSPSVEDALGLDFRDPIVNWHGRYIALSWLNDNARFSLAEIGAVIASQPDEWDGKYTPPYAEWWDVPEDVPRPVLESV